MKIYKQQLKEILDETKKVLCPALVGEEIVFNAKGINHLIYKGDTRKSKFASRRL